MHAGSEPAKTAGWTISKQESRFGHFAGLISRNSWLPRRAFSTLLQKDSWRSIPEDYLLAANKMRDQSARVYWQAYFA